MRIQIKAGSKLKIEGPAALFIKDGKVEVLGKSLVAREKITVPKSKSILVTALEDSIVEINIGEGGKFEEFSESTIPYEWTLSAERILSLPKPLTILILGGVDVGKTAFTIYLSNLLTSKGNKVIIIDEDLGQSEIGAPTTIGMAYVTRPIASLAQAKYITGYFVGSTSPSGVIHRVLIGVRTLLDKAKGHNPDYIIINTDGWIYGKDARELKIGIIMLTKPNVIIAIQKSNEVEPIIKPFESQNWVTILRLIAPSTMRIRTLDERRLIRESMYYKHLGNAKIIKLPLSKVSLMYADVGVTYPLPPNDFKEIINEIHCTPVYAGYNAESLVIVLPKNEKRIREIKNILKNRDPNKNVKVIKEGDEKGLIVGLYDNSGNFLGVGIIQEINYKKGYIKLLSKAEGNISLIKVGRIKLNEQLSEIGKLDSWPL